MPSALRIGFILGLVILTACAAVLGVPDLYFDEKAVPNVEDANGGAGEGGPGTDGGSSGTVTSCKADLQTDPKNCGACDHDCANGHCAEGVCTLAENLASPTHLAVRNGTVYLGLQGEDAIASCPTSGCASATVGLKKLTADDAGSFQPNRVVANDTYVYAADYYSSNGGRVLRVPVGGGPLVKLPSVNLDRGYGVAIDDSALYWTNHATPGNIYACLLSNCSTPQNLAAATDPELIAVGSNGAIVWGDRRGYELRRCTSRTACNAANLITGTAPLGAVNDLVIDGTTAYWGTNYGTIYSCSSAGCANATKIVEESPSAIIGAIAVSGTFLAWSSMPFIDENNVDDSLGVVKSCTMPKCSGADVKVHASKQKDPSGMALDPKSIYWSNSGKRGFVDGIGTIVKAPR